MVRSQAATNTSVRTAKTGDRSLKLHGFQDGHCHGTCRSLPSFSLGILGDLHLAPEQMHLFHDARDHLVAASSSQGARIAQLGDLGHGKHAPGSRACFEFAKRFMDGFKLPYAMILGNHDMEGDEFATDPDNLEAWIDVWQQPHYWAAELGTKATVIGLSTTRYRSNNFSHHEVYINDTQMEWFEQQLQAATAAGRAVIVLTHAPPQGCGLKFLQEVHVKNRCAWLNHSDRPERFMRLVEKYPAIKLWFSGHFHLSHNYQDSISVVGSCAFVQVGVIGECNRDGFRHSRLLRGTQDGWELCTVEHQAGGSVRVDAQGGWAPSAQPSILTPAAHIIKTEDATGWLCAPIDCSVEMSKTERTRRQRLMQTMRWFPVGNRTMVALQGNTLLEYDIATAAPIGLLGKVPPGCNVILRDAQGNELSETREGDGSDVAVVEVVDTLTGGSTRYPRNEQGCFFVIYQPNKWKLKHAKLLAEREAAAAAATDHSGTAGKASGNGTGGRSDTPQTAVSAQVVGTKVAAQ